MAADSTIATVDDYVAALEPARQAAMKKLRSILKKNLKGTQECISYGMVGYVVPKKIFPAGYHCSPELPLPWVSIASQKNFIAIYHMGVYANAALQEWFTAEWPKHSATKLDMGKSCIRFKKVEDIPYKLIEALMQKQTMQEWITIYTNLLNKNKK